MVPNWLGVSVSEAVPGDQGLTHRRPFLFGAVKGGKT